MEREGTETEVSSYGLKLWSFILQSIVFSISRRIMLHDYMPFTSTSCWKSMYIFMLSITFNYCLVF